MNSPKDMHIFSAQYDEKKYNCCMHAILQVVLIKSSDLKSRHLPLQTAGINVDDKG